MWRKAFVGMPPCGSETKGRHKLLMLYSNARKLSLSQHTVSSNVYTTKVTNLPLKDYCIVRKYYCDLNHTYNCIKCDRMIKAGTNIRVLPLTSI